LRTALAEATTRLASAGVVSASTDARALIQAAAGTGSPLVLLDALPADFEETLESLLHRRERREPLQIILGETYFRRLRLRVRPGVFVPRQETELIVDHVLAATRSGSVRTVVDLCTGSGAVAAAVLDEVPAARVIAIEKDPLAVRLAQENLAAVAPSPRGRVLQADVTDPSLSSQVLEALQVTAVDVVVSNPPYIPPDSVPVDQEVRDHDPHDALFGGGADGLEVPRHVIDRAAELLRPDGMLVMEHADVQGPATRELAESSGRFENITTARDLTGRDRFLSAYRTK
jgi:release factor glutamine methyltransferase